MNTTELYVSVVQFGKLYRVVQILSLSELKSLRMTVPVALFFNKMVLTFESV